MRLQLQPYRLTGELVEWHFGIFPDFRSTVPLEQHLPSLPVRRVPRCHADPECHAVAGRLAARCIVVADRSAKAQPQGLSFWQAHGILDGQ